MRRRKKLAGKHVQTAVPLPDLKLWIWSIRMEFKWGHAMSQTGSKLGRPEPRNMKLIEHGQASHTDHARIWSLQPVRSSSRPSAILRYRETTLICPAPRPRLPGARPLAARGRAGAALNRGPPGAGAPPPAGWPLLQQANTSSSGHLPPPVLPVRP